MASNSQSRSLAPLFFVLLGGVAVCLAISSQSFWIDECETALKVIAPTLRGMWHALVSEHNSNMQLPLYMLYAWGWARLFGVSEISLRAANIPWFFVGLLAILHFLRRRPGLRNAALMVYCLHPFVWYYLNEARPYLMQLSGALLVGGGVLAVFEDEEHSFSPSWWWLFGSGLIILCGAGILGVPWAIGLVLPLVFRPTFWKTMLRTGLPSALVCVPLLVILALYFAWTLTENIGAGPRPANITSVASVFYDQLGFIGLGPGRADLRPRSLVGSNTALSAFVPFLLPICTLGLPLAWGLILAARRRFGLSPDRFVLAVLLAVCPAIAVFGLGYLRHTRMVSRHLTPLFPFVLLALAYMLQLLWKSGGWLERATAVLIVAALMVSSLEIRFAKRHSKDDDRAAVAAANQSLAEGKTVWWAASPQSAAYYHLRYDETGDHPGTAWLVNGAPPNFTALPDEVFLSKPDLFDASGSLTRFLANHHYRLSGRMPAFTVWER